MAASLSVNSLTAKVSPLATHTFNLPSVEEKNTKNRETIS
jgi:hypothetical protein